MGSTPVGSFSKPMSRAPQSQGRASSGSFPELKSETKSRASVFHGAVFFAVIHASLDKIPETLVKRHEITA